MIPQPNDSALLDAYTEAVIRPVEISTTLLIMFAALVSAQAPGAIESKI